MQYLMTIKALYSDATQLNVELSCVAINGPLVTSHLYGCTIRQNLVFRRTILRYVRLLCLSSVTFVAPYPEGYNFRQYFCSI